jgi:hypothetical protein
MENIGSEYRRLVLMKSPLRAPASESVMIYEGGFIDKCPNYLGPSQAQKHSMANQDFESVKI